MAEQMYTIHNPYIIRLQNIIAITQAQRYIGLNLYAQFTDKCFS